MSDPALMPLVTPFVGERFGAVERLGDFIAPPYDVISSEQRSALARRSPHNIVHLILPEGDGDKYAVAKAQLESWRTEGVLAREDDEYVYVVQQRFDTASGGQHSRTGVIGAVAVEPFGTGRVKPHERTHAEPKADRLALMRATKAMFETLLMCGRDEGGTLRAQLEQLVTTAPMAEAETEDTQLRLWRVGGSTGRSLAEAAGAGQLYIADGHHRYETAIAYKQENAAARRTLGLIVPLGDPGLEVLATHRLVYAGAADVEGVLKELRDRFQIHELSPELSYVEHLTQMRERGTACVVVRPGGGAVSLLLRPGANLGDLPFANEPSVASLDVARFDELVVKRLLASGGPDARLGYSADAGRVIDEVVAGDAAAGVLLNPCSVEQVLAVSDAGAAMPQKATYFHPKVPSGLVIMGYE